MVYTYKRKVGARNYKSYSNETLDAALHQVQSKKMSLRKASKTYNIPLGTLSNKMKRKHMGAAGHPAVFSKKEELLFVEHIQVVGQWGFPFKMLDLRMLAKIYLNANGRKVAIFKNNLPSSSWAKKFLKRHQNALSKRTCRNIKRSRAQLNSKTVLSYFDNLKHHVEGVAPSNIFNFDETNLTDDPGVKQCIFKRGTKYPERVKDNSKTSISIMYCGSADGKILPCYVVYKAENLWSTWMEGGPRGTRYNRSRSGWFDATTFTDWFEYLFLPNVKNVPGRKVLIGDNLSSHFTKRALQLAQENGIDFCCLPPNSTHLMQPLDVAFFAPLKRAWRNILDDWKSSKKNSSTTLSKNYFPSLLRKLHSQLFSQFGTTDHSDNLVSGFKACGICPFQPDAVLKKLPDFQTDADEVQRKASVSDAFIDTLKSMRGVKDDGEPPKKRRAKVNVTPGKGVTPTDMESSSDSESKAASNDESDSSSDASTSSESEDTCNSHDSNASDTSFVASSNQAGLSVSVGDFVIVSYEGSSFPGKVTEVDEEGAKVSTLTKCGRGKGWRWPAPADEIDYKWDKIVKSNVQFISINNRGHFRVPALESEWGV